MATKISLKALKALAFVGAPLLKTINYVIDGEEFEFDVYIRRFGYQAAVNHGKASLAEGDSYAAGRIAACILNVDGSPMFESSDHVEGKGKWALVLDENGAPLPNQDPELGGLTESLTFALHGAILEVNTVGKSNLTTSQNSGANSSSTESVEEPSTKRNKKSVPTSL